LNQPPLSEGAVVQVPRPTRRLNSIGFKAILRCLRGAVATLWDDVRHRLPKARMDRRFQRFGEALLADAGVTLTVEGDHHVRPGAIYMSNHPSIYDIPLVASQVPGVRMIAKIELFRIPIWGRALRAAGIISIDRSDRSKAIASLEAAAASMKTGVSIWMAPEGTRSRAGKIQPFKKGGFIMAIEAGATIVPISIQGSDLVLPPHSLAVQRDQAVTMRFHPAVDAGRFTLETRDALMAEVLAAIASGLPAGSAPDEPQH
jgi:1-acyl-sn-glycerol-3-phosphate acyltransferase